MSRRRVLTLAPAVLLVAVAAASFRWSVWAVGRDVGVIVERGAVYVGTDIDWQTPGVAVYDVYRTWEEGFGTAVDRRLPVRRLRPWFFVVQLWPSALLAAGVAWWGRPRARGRGFELGPPVATAGAAPVMTWAGAIVRPAHKGRGHRPEDRPRRQPLGGVPPPAAGRPFRLVGRAPPSYHPAAGGMIPGGSSDVCPGSPRPGAA